MNLHNAEFVRSVTSVADCPKDGLPQIAFAGKSNVGKSSVINKLLLRKNFARVGEAPGKTTHINFFRIDEAMYLVDLPGYGYAKVPQKEKERWGRLMEAYFAAPATLTFGVMLVDARHAPTANDVVMANYFLQSGKPFVVVANKLDKLKKSEIAPNLAGLAESCTDLAPGQAVSVYIKNILPEKMKIKLVIVNHALSQSHRFELRYFITEGHLDHWLYSTPESHKRIETDFSVMACNPA